MQYKNAHRKNSEREKSNKQQKIQSHKIMFSAGKELKVILKMRERNKCEPIHFNCKSTAILVLQITFNANLLYTCAVNAIELAKMT